MQKWEKFENECAEYLEDIIKNTNLKVKKNGGSNSNEGDIDIVNDKKIIMNIECKLSPSQAGQFVIKEEENGFTISKRNKNVNKFSNKILDFINKNKLTPEKQKGVTIKLPDYILSHWLIEHYSNKKTEFIITSDSLNSFKAIIPLKNISDYFKMEAILRRKKSGSHDVSKKNRDFVKEEIKKFIDSNKGKLNKFELVNKKLFVDFFLKNKKDRYYLNNSRIFLKFDEETKQYVVRELSKTNNLTVIFQLQYIGYPENLNRQALINLIEERNS